MIHRHFAFLRLLPIAVALLTICMSPAASTSPGLAQTVGTHTVSWDSHSLLLDGRRLFIYSGEFHYWRLPSQSQWLDRLEKIKAAGLNAVSIYFDWQYHSQAPGEYDFSGPRDINHLLDITDRLGLFVIARVGPYMNAEVDAGGLPGWVLTKPLFPRSQTWDGSGAHPQYSALYTQYSQEWYDHLLPILARHQATDGKSVLLMSVENEYSQQNGSLQYMSDLLRIARTDGIRVPIFHNDFWFRGDWNKVVDLYAYDSYPYGFDCCHQWYDEHFHGIDTWETHLRSELGVTTPMFVSELQGGAFDPWGGRGYQAVADTLNDDWLNALDQSAFAQGTTLLNTYMFAGGTSWGYMSEPGVYTSYDYGAPISEAGLLRPSYYAAHRLAMFLQSYGPALAGADARPTFAVPNGQSVVVHSRVNGATGQFFVFLRHGDPGSPSLTRVQIPVANKTVSVPQKEGTAISVPGHGATLLTGSVDVGPLHMNYSTSQVLTDASTAQGHYLVLFGPPGSQGELDFALPTGALQVLHNPGVEVSKQNGELRLNYVHTAVPRTVAIRTVSGTVRVLITTPSTASRIWTADDLLVQGPDLVVATGGKLQLRAQVDRDVRVYGADEGRSIELAGAVSAPPDGTMGEILLGTLHGTRAVEVPSLTHWLFQPESPEIQPGFDDSSWQLANHAGTSNPFVTSTPSLLADDYGFHYGFVWYRGHFSASGQETGITISARQSYSVYLNGSYLGSVDTTLSDPPHSYDDPQTFSFPAAMLRPGQDNVVSVLTESLGHDEGWLAGPLAQSPQGILSARLMGSQAPLIWRIQGNAEGEGPGTDGFGGLNASGLYGERNGWYLPGYNDRTWEKIGLPDSWIARNITSAVGWYRSHFRLDLRAGSDVPLGLTIPHASDKAVIWLNGMLIGRYWEQRGPQHTFYLPAGLLNTHGDNTLAIAVWNRGHEGGLTSEPTLTAYASSQEYVAGLTRPVAVSEPDYWHTDGNRIVDSHDRPVRIAAVNWAGMQGKYFVPAGLETLSLKTIVSRIRGLGFNAIRLPFSNQLVEQNPVVRAHLEANPDLQGLRALEVMDRVVDAAREQGLRVILENHRSDVGADPQDNGLWYTAAYPESTWIRDWKDLVDRYRHDATVVGIDLRNEPHTGPPGPWSISTYLHQGATWGPYRGVDNPRTDWRLAAERGGNAVLARNPNLLIFVEGVQQYPDATQPGGLDSYWWGGILTPAARYPVLLSVPHRLVYSPHEYGPYKYQMPFFGPKMTYSSQKDVWNHHWGFLEQGARSRQTPIFIGEFGTCGSSRRCIADTTPGSQGLWFQFLMKYLRRHPEIGWSFWALNGTNPDGTDQPNYILGSDWQTQRMHQLVDTLHDIETPPPPAPVS